VTPRARALRTAAAICCLSCVAPAAACTSDGGGPATPSYTAPSPQPSDTAAQPPAAAGKPGEWLTYNGGIGRQGVATAETASGTAPAPSPTGKPSLAWRAPLDGAVYGQPLLLGDHVLAATENDSVYALDQTDGRVLWRAHLGNPQPRSGLRCGNIDPLGITSTMAYDPSTGSLFALAETDGGHHTLYALDPAGGAVRWQRPAEPPEGTPIDTQQRAALTVAFGRVYVPFGALFGDCGDYIGSVVGTPTSGQGSQVAYHVPTTRGGGIWAPGGLLTVGSTLYAATANGASTSGYDGSVSLIALSPELSRLDYFAPTTWPQDNAADLGLGSLTPALIGGRILALGKTGTAYLLAADRLGGIGGQIAQTQVCPAFGAAAVRGSTAYAACRDGVRALEVTGSQIKVLWKSAEPANGSPTLAGGGVWAVDYNAGVLYRFDASTGAVTAQLPLGPVPHFASPTLGIDRAYIGTMSGVTAVTQ